MFSVTDAAALQAAHLDLNKLMRLLHGETDGRVQREHVPAAVGEAASCWTGRLLPPTVRRLSTRRSP
jgi:hypothetical protein